MPEATSRAGKHAPEANQTRVGRNLRAGLVFFLLIATAVFGTHYPLWQLPYFWDEMGQFVPAALDFWQHGAWLPTSTSPNIHPPGLTLWLAGVWGIFGHSITATRLAMLAMGSVSAFLAFLLALRLGNGVPGLPGFHVLLLLLVSPLFYTQAMMAQLDMPAMLFTLLAIYLFVEERLLLAVVACTLLVWMKETGVVLPVTMGVFLYREQRKQEAWLFLLPCVSLAPWLLLLWKETGSIFGNREFAEFNLTYPLHPARLGLALLRRGFELFVNHGYLLGALPLAVLWKRLEVFRRREWRLILWFVTIHVLVVTVTGGAVLERYLLPVLPLVLTAYCFSWSHLPGKWRVALPLATAGLSLLGFFYTPGFPQPHENNLRMVRLVALMRVASQEAQLRDAPSGVATAWPLSDALRRPEFGYVSEPVAVVAMRDFSDAELVRAAEANPHSLIWYSRDPSADSWLFRHFPALSHLRESIYDWHDDDDPVNIEQLTGLREVSRLRVGGESVAVFRRPATAR